MAKKKGGSKKDKKSRISFMSGFLIMLFILFCLNSVVQIVRKPSEFISFVGWSKNKTLEQTWLNYGHLFDSHSTAVMTPTFLAAMAQAESSGNPLATPQWTFRWTDRLFQIFSPASTSVGLYQFTDGTFHRAKKYCVQNGVATSSGCWLNWFYWRTSPSNSIELASAYLTVSVNAFINQFGNISFKKKRQLAAVIHLCGIQKGKHFIRSNFSLPKLRNCGSHNVANYVHRVENYEERFRQISVRTIARASID